MKSRLVIILLGVFLMIIALSYGYSIFSPNESEAQMDNDTAQRAELEGDKLSQSQKRVDLAKKTVAEQAEVWRGIEDQYTPSTNLANGGINIGENAWQLVVDTPKYRDSVQKEVNDQIKKGGVKVLQGPFVTNPPQSGATILADYFNYPAIPFPVVIFDLGQIQVQGNWNQIMTNVKSWATMPRYLAVADGLRIDGTSPYLTGTYNVSIVGYIRGNQIYVPVPESAAPSGGGGGLGTSGGGGFGGPGMSKGGGMGPSKGGIGPQMQGIGVGK